MTYLSEISFFAVFNNQSLFFEVGIKKTVLWAGLPDVENCHYF